MRFSDIIRSAVLQLRVNPLRTAATLLGIVVSVGFLVAVVAIIQGMNAYVKENIAEAMIGMNTFLQHMVPIGTHHQNLFEPVITLDERAGQNR